MVDFHLSSNDIYSTAFRELGINTFSEACEYVQKLPYGRNANRTDFTLVLTEQKGTCSSKHALLAYLADENKVQEVELIVGIFLMSPETNPVLTDFFANKPYTAIPEAHCYLRYNGERFDYTAVGFDKEKIGAKIIREQRAEPNQVSEWKPAIHKHYMESWLKRNPQIELTVDELWAEREQCIALLS